MLPGWNFSPGSSNRAESQPGPKVWSCNRLLCFNRILSLGRAEISARAENSPCIISPLYSLMLNSWRNCWWKPVLTIYVRKPDTELKCDALYIKLSDCYIPFYAGWSLLVEFYTRKQRRKQNARTFWKDSRYPSPLKHAISVNNIMK
jgi:hypothetical protein